MLTGSAGPLARIRASRSAAAARRRWSPRARERRWSISAVRTASRASTDLHAAGGVGRYLMSCLSSGTLSSAV